MKMSTFLLLFLLVSAVNTDAQNTRWTEAPLSNLGFTENLNRYEDVMDEEIEFYAEYGLHKIFFSNDAIIIGKAKDLSNDELHERHEKLEHGEEVKPYPWNYFKIEFENTNPAAKIQYLEQKHHTRNFQNPLKPTETVLANAYDKVVYKNIYKNIDLEFQIPSEGGVKYNFLVHPNANPKEILMSYIGAEVKLNENGSLAISSQVSPFTDQAPVSTLLDKKIESRFQVENNKVSFNLSDYDKSEELIIDPWLVAILPGATTGMEVAADNNGNTTVLAYNFAQEVLYYDNTGTLQWTYGSVGSGDLTMHPTTGEIYYVEGLSNIIYQLDVLGVLMTTNPMCPIGGSESWRVKYSDFHDKITASEGGSVGLHKHVSIMENDLSTYDGYISLPDIASPMEDCALFEVDPVDGSFYYCPSANFGGAPTIYGNYLHKLDALDPTIMLWDSYTYHSFAEVGNASYGGLVNGVNGIACGTNYVYTYDGNKVVRFDKVTGVIVDSLNLPRTVMSQYGIDTDECGNLYVGSVDEVTIYTEDMVETGAYPMPGPCRDLLVVGNILYVTGENFLTEIELAADSSLTVSATTALCEACNGTATFSIGGCGDVDIEAETILWSPSGSTDETATDLCEGWHTVTVTWIDEDGITITQVDSVEVTSVEIDIDVDVVLTEESCTGSCNGTATFTPTSGEGPYSYTLEGETNGTGVFDELCAGTYDITVVDANGCEYTGTITITTGDGLELVVVTQNDPTCYGFTDGSITVTAVGIGGDVTYTWLPENPIDGATFNTIGAGTYIVYGSYGDDCSDSLVIVLNNPDSLWADMTIIDPLCFGDSTGIALITDVYNAQGDLDNISFFWAPNYFGEEGVGIDSAYNMPDGTYTVTINDDNGCSNVMDFTITEPTELVFSEFGFEPAFCRLHAYQSGNGVVYAAATGGTPDYTYEWMNLETSVTTNNSTWGGLNPGPYQITITDDNGCTLIEAMQLDSVSPIAAFTVDSDQLDEFCEGTELVIANFINESENFANPNDPSADTTFLWNLDHPNVDWSISHDYFEIMDSSYAGEAIYEVCLIALNKNGCADTACKNLIVHIQPDLIAPNIFTPGGNGVNDMFTFEFLTAGIEKFQCTIVNRWGVKVAELNNINAGWDGTDRNGDDCVAGVYFYVYEAVSTNGTAFNGQGNVQLLRVE